MTTYRKGRHGKSKTRTGRPYRRAMIASTKARGRG